MMPGNYSTLPGRLTPDFLDGAAREEALMVDPVCEQAGRDTANLNQFGLKLVCIDHVTKVQPKKIAKAVAANLRGGAG